MPYGFDAIAEGREIETRFDEPANTTPTDWAALIAAIPANEELF